MAAELPEDKLADLLAACDDEGVIGAPFYVMKYEEGVVITSSVPPHLDPLEERGRVLRRRLSHRGRSRP